MSRNCSILILLERISCIELSENNCGGSIDDGDIGSVDDDDADDDIVVVVGGRMASHGPKSMCERQNSPWV